MNVIVLLKNVFSFIFHTNHCTVRVRRLCVLRYPSRTQYEYAMTLKFCARTSLSSIHIEDMERSPDSPTFRCLVNRSLGYSYRAFHPPTLILPRGVTVFLDLRGALGFSGLASRATEVVLWTVTEHNQRLHHDPP